MLMLRKEIFGLNPVKSVSGRESKYKSCIGYTHYARSRCFSNMKIESCHTNPIEGINKYTLKFIKHPNSPVNLLNSMISVGDPVVVSKENGGKIAVTVGFVVDIGKKSVIINADKKINAEAIDNEPVYGVSKDECLQLFRIDKGKIQQYN